MKTTKLFRAVAPMLLAFVLFLSANVAKAQYYGRPVSSQEEVPTNERVVTYTVSPDNSYITLYRYMKVDNTTFTPHVINFTVNIALEIKDPTGAVVYTTTQYGIPAGQGQAMYYTGLSSGYSGYTYRVIGVTTNEGDPTFHPYFYDAVVRTIP